MSTEQGTITRVSGDKAWVQVRRSSMCAACSARGVCATLGSAELMEAEALNTAGGSVGERVLLKISTRSLWKISFIFYMLPVFFLIPGAILGMKLAPSFSLRPELGALILAALGCLLAFLIIKVFAGRLSENKDYLPEVIKIFSPGPAKEY